MHCFEWYFDFHPISRLPYNWQTPMAYFPTVGLQIALVYFCVSMFVVALFFCITFATFMLAFASDFEMSLHRLDHKIATESRPLTTQERIQLKTDLIAVIRFHVDIKQLSCNFHCGNLTDFFENSFTICRLILKYADIYLYLYSICLAVPSIWICTTLLMLDIVILPI